MLSGRLGYCSAISVSQDLLAHPDGLYRDILVVSNRLI